MEKTAMQILISQLKEKLKTNDEKQTESNMVAVYCDGKGSGYNDAILVAIDLLQSEKQQIQLAYNIGYTQADEVSSEDYYNETFKQQ